MNTQIALSNQELKAVAPSVFAKTAWEGVSARYAFIPTIQTVDALRDSGFMPVRATQTVVRVPGKRDFTKHMLRFRHRADIAKKATKGGELVEIIVTNAHDRSSAYLIDAGIYLCICDNGMVVKSTDFGSIHVRHSGQVVEDVLRGTAAIVKRAPLIRQQVAAWRAVTLTERQQLTLAEAVLIYRYGLDAKGANLLSPVTPAALLAPRRLENVEKNLWVTTNVIQENLMRGELPGVSGNGRRVRTRPITSVNTELEINRQVWLLAETMAERIAA